MFIIQTETGITMVNRHYNGVSDEEEWRIEGE